MNDERPRPEAPIAARRIPELGPTVPEEVEEELGFHLEMRVRDLVAKGMSEAEARAEALRRFGDLSEVRSECRRLGEERESVRRRGELLAELRQDLVFGLRQLRRAPGFTVVATLTLALGIGATTAVFSVVEAVLLRPLPWPAADRLVVPEAQEISTGDTWNTTYADYLDWREARVFSDVALWQSMEVNLAAEGQEPERVAAVRVTDGFFSTLGVAPLLGRHLRPEEFVLGSPRRALISEGLWLRRFGGDRDVVGRSTLITDVPVEIIGVVPQEMVFPQDTELWFPVRIAPEDQIHYERRDNFVFVGIARLAPGRTLAETRSQLAVRADRFARETPQARRGVTVTATPLAAWAVGPTLPRALWLMLGAVGLVLLIGCVNVANLLLARGAARRRELGVRAALGAGRARLLRQLLAESVVLGAVGGALGVLVAAAGTRALAAAAPADLPRLEHVTVNLPVLLFALGTALFATLLFGGAPALRGAGEDGAGLLAGVVTRAAAGERRGSRRLLVAGELALALVLLLGSGLLLRSLLELRGTDPGFRTSGLLSFGLSLQGERYGEIPAQLAVFAAVQDRIAALPGVERVGMISALPLGGGGFYLGRAFLADGWPEPPAGEDLSGQWTVVSPGTFAALGVPLVRGRDFDTRDRDGSTPTIIVNQEFVRRMFPGQDPIGKRVRSWRDENVYREIVGVVGDVRYFSAGDEIRPVVYVPQAQATWDTMVVLVRSREGLDSGAVLPELRRAVAGVDPRLPLDDVQTMDEVFARSVAPRRFGALLLVGFAAIALVLALVGVYGVLAYEVGQRRREIGIRMALGSRRASVVGMVVREAAALVLAGVAVGLLAGLLLARLVAPLLYETPPRDPATFALAPAALALVALFAAWLPARRASRVDPMQALRTD